MSRKAIGAREADSRGAVGRSDDDSGEFETGRADVLVWLVGHVRPDRRGCSADNRIPVNPGGHARTARARLLLGGPRVLQQKNARRSRQEARGDGLHLRSRRLAAVGQGGAAVVPAITDALHALLVARADALI